MPDTTQPLSKTMADTTQALSYLWTAFVPTEVPLNPVVACSSVDGKDWPNYTSTGQYTGDTPSLAFFNGQLYCAYCVVADGTNNVYVTSTADGTDWSNPTNTYYSSSTAPSLAAYNGQLYLAYVADDGTNNLYVTSTGDGTDWSNPTNTGHSSSTAPSLAALSSQLCCAYIGTDPGDTNVYVTSTDDGTDWSAKTPTGQSSTLAPSLAVFNGALYCAYVADDGTNNVYVISYDPAAGWGGNTYTGQSSKLAPSLAAYIGRLYCAYVADDGTNDVYVTFYDPPAWGGNTNTSQSSGLASEAGGPSLAAPPTPLYLKTVVNSSAMLNVGDANLPAISSGLVGSLPDGGAVDYTPPNPEQGSWSTSPTLITFGGCVEYTVTVNPTITANWNDGGNSAGTWTSSDLQNAFASALGAVMQNIPTAYQSYSYAEEIPNGDTGTITCGDPQPLDFGHCIPPAIQITAYSTTDGSQAGQVTVTYSAGDQTGSSACDTIEALAGVLAIFPNPVTSVLAATIGAATGIFCDIIGSS
jgi:hypothetical protein